MALNDEYFDLTLDPQSFAELEELALITFEVPAAELSHEQAMALTLTMMLTGDGQATQLAWCFIQSNNPNSVGTGIMAALDAAEMRGILRPLRISLVPTWWQRLTFRRGRVLSWS
ncbi:hypothetical protein [Nocardia flavorosea]|uniref:Uncharacterized protein n=1 Tax=Nocardia flavorosea TaxID=53429 RepID=A0A846YPE6_9NOCA|nr:hypothetical protein [Nocardia flavorosea]NKY60995.1 hypothetical protein [Nocardia flavorosea]